MRFLTIAWRNLLRRPARTLLTMAGLAIAVAAVVALVGISEGFERTYVDLFNERQVDIVVQRGTASQNLNRTLEMEVGDKLRKIRGVNEVFPGQMDMVSFPDYDLSTVIAVGWDPES